MYIGEREGESWHEKRRVWRESMRRRVWSFIHLSLLIDVYFPKWFPELLFKENTCWIYFTRILMGIGAYERSNTDKHYEL